VIETEQSISIGSSIDTVWEYVKDIQNWASLMPGSQSCTMTNPDDSRWTLKVGAGGLVRTVTVLVHVEQWDAPFHVRFSYKLQGDPVVGRGSYTAARISAHETEVTLEIRVQGSGPMSQLWEAMSTTLLPQLAKSFAGRLKAEIESATCVAAAQTAVASHGTSLLGALNRWLLIRWRAIVGSGLR
jgi:carbon monoxide dehydrogenase subunit G